ncbi:MAG: hypothetical protein IJS88_05045 [Alphaproteobacteria bacterium]|nr:hypothetical protein [Alphaproteobacteria bacterium]
MKKKVDAENEYVNIGMKLNNCEIMKIFIKTINEQISEYITVSLIMDDYGMKYVIRDARSCEKTSELQLGVEVPSWCRNEIMRRCVLNKDAQTGVLSKNQVVSQKLDDYLCYCWNMILLKESQRLGK